MLTLLALAMLSGGGERLYPCTTSCFNDGRDGDGVYTCFYDLRPACGRLWVCQERENVVCRPVSIPLGTFIRIREWDGETPPVVTSDPPSRGGGETSVPYVW